jgi:hypothetical protein
VRVCAAGSGHDAELAALRHVELPPLLLKAIGLPVRLHAFDVDLAVRAERDAVQRAVARHDGGLAVGVEQDLPDGEAGVDEAAAAADAVEHDLDGSGLGTAPAAVSRGRSRGGRDAARRSVVSRGWLNRSRNGARRTRRQRDHVDPDQPRRLGPLVGAVDDVVAFALQSMEPMKLLATKLTCRGVPPPTGTTMTLLNASVSPPYASQRLSGDHVGRRRHAVATRRSLPDSPVAHAQLALLVHEADVGEVRPSGENVGQ